MFLKYPVNVIDTSPACQLTVIIVSGSGRDINGVLQVWVLQVKHCNVFQFSLLKVPKWHLKRMCWRAGRRMNSGFFSESDLY